MTSKGKRVSVETRKRMSIAQHLSYTNGNRIKAPSIFGAPETGKKTSGVYVIRNNITKECYVGSSKGVEHRMGNHKYGYTNAPLLNKAIQDYGSENFSFELLEECKEKDLKVREKYWMEILSPSYNINKVKA